MTRAGDQPTEIDAPGLRELVAEGLLGAAALYFLVRIASRGINGYWWICLAIFSISLMSFLRTLWRAWSMRTQSRSLR